MQELWLSFKEWFLSLGPKYGVDPLIFGSIYVGAIPFFTLSVGWIVRNYRQNINLTWPILSASFFFISAYLYLFVVGKNIPWWVYALLFGMIGYGAYSTVKSIKAKAKKKPRDPNAKDT
jgi:O-antigen/teichoic acid export membrane protein